MMAVKNQIEDRQPFCEWLKQRRIWCDRTQRDLAEAAGCSPETICKVEAGRLCPSKALAARLAQALKIPKPACSAFIDFARGRFKEVPIEPTVYGVSNHHPVLIHHHPLQGPTSPLVGRKDEIAKASGLLLGIIFLMTVKPTLLVSLIVIGISLLLGLLLSLINQGRTSKGRK